MSKRPRPSWPEDRLRELKELTDSGLTATQIAGLLGISRNSVIGAWHRNAEALDRKVQPRPKARTTPSPVIVVHQSPDKLIIGNGAVYRTIVKTQPQESTPDRNDTVPFIELTPFQCRYPMWGRERSTHKSPACGRPTAFGSYCSEHHDITHVQC